MLDAKNSLDIKEGLILYGYGEKAATIMTLKYRNFFLPSVMPFIKKYLHTD